MTYDVLDNERHKAVCELRKLSDSPSDIWVWKRQLGEAIGADNEMYSSINERLIHLLRGGVEPTTLRELFGILKEGDGGVDAGGRVETGGGRSDAAADGHMADSAGDQVSEGVAPITAELRELMGGVEPRVDEDGVVTAKYVTPEAWGEFDRICDAIDAVHAGLERENAELRQRVAVLDNADGNMHDGWIRLPLDADGEYIHAGDVLDGYGKSIEVVELRHGRSGWVLISRDGNGYADTFAFTHHHAPTVEDVLRELLDEAEHFHSLEEERDAISEFAAKLRLAGDAE